jgi:hypothetical protein
MQHSTSVSNQERVMCLIAMNGLSNFSFFDIKWMVELMNRRDVLEECESHDLEEDGDCHLWPQSPAHVIRTLEQIHTMLVIFHES